MFGCGTIFESLTSARIIRRCSTWLVLKIHFGYKGESRLAIFFTVLKCCCIVQAIGMLTMGNYSTKMISGLEMPGTRSFKYVEPEYARIDAFTKLNSCRLNTDFELFLFNYFSHWFLTQTEMDIAILTLKGLTYIDICQITSMTQANCQHSIKAVLEKSGCGTVHEFKMLCFDEFWCE